MNGKAPCRLCFALGPWHVIALTAARLSMDEDPARVRGQRRNKLVLFRSANEETSSLAARIAESLVYWDEIIIDNGTLMKPPPDHWPLPIENLIKECREAIGEINVEELWVSHLDNYYHRLIFESYPDADIHLYEDGLYGAAAYTLERRFQALREWRQWPAMMRRGRWSDVAASRRLHGWRLARRTFRRVTARHNWLAARFPTPRPFGAESARRFDAGHVSRVIQQARLRVPELNEWRADEQGDRPRVVILSQFACREVNDRHAHFLSGYERIVGDLLNWGYRIYWKEHPLTRQPVGKLFQEKFGAEHVVEMDSHRHVPIELLARPGAFHACVAMSSAALYHLKELYGIEGYTCLDVFQDVLPDNKFGHNVKRMMAPLPSWRLLRKESEKS